MPDHEGQKSDQDGHDHAETAARATLLALWAVVTAEEAGRRVADDEFVFKGRSVQYGEMVRTLAAAPKPVACSAEVVGHRLKVTCDRLTNPMHVAMHSARLSSLADDLAELEGKFASHRQPLALLVRTAGASLLMSAADYESWRRDYFLALNHTVGFREPDREARASGATVVLELGSGSGVRIEDD